jgi:hypothetical protein
MFFPRFNNTRLNCGKINLTKLTKMLINKFIYQPVNEFIENLRINFGQFWIRQIPNYDSRNYSLGYYASHVLNMKSSLDSGKTWKVVDPDSAEVSKVIFRANPPPDYRQLLTEEDWQFLSEHSYSNKSSNVFLIRSHRLCEEGDLRLAFIEGVSALELSIHEFIRSRASSKSLIKSSEAFYNLPLHTQLTILCSSLEPIPQEQIESSIKAIKIRNKIVHDGINPTDDKKTLLYDLLKTVSYLSGNEVRKFPSYSFSVCSVPEENWLKFYKRSIKR